MINLSSYSIKTQHVSRILIGAFLCSYSCFSFAANWDWMHRNFRLNYWYDVDSVSHVGNGNLLAKYKASGICQFQDPKSKEYSRYTENTVEINCADQEFAFRKTDSFRKDGSLLKTKTDFDGKFRSAYTTGLVKLMSKACNKEITKDVPNVDTRPNELERFTDDCVVFSYKTADGKPSSRVISESYVDISHMYFDEGVIYSWVRVNHETPIKSSAGNTFVKYDAKVAIKCKSRDVAISEYYLSNDKNVTVESWKVPTKFNLNWESARPGYQNEGLVNSVCSKNSENDSTTGNQAKKTSPAHSIEPVVASTGSGFFVGSKNVITNNHVVEGCKKIHVQGENATLINADKNADLALLKIEKNSKSIAQLRFNKVRIGEDVAAAGFPLNGLISGYNLTRGNVSGLSGLRGDSRLLQITAPVQPGNSGGPLLDASGNIVGVIVSKLSWRALSITGDIPENVNFAININSLKSFLNANDLDPLVSSVNTKPLIPADVADKAKDFTVLIECLK